MNSRKNKARYFDNVALAASTVLADTSEIAIGAEGYVAIQVLIDNGAGGAPTDTPVGVWELHASGDGKRFTPVAYANLTTELARIAPNGNNLVDAWAIITGLPGCAIKLRYLRTSGGGTNARATVHVSW
jgi:hypothetical protein